MSGCCIFGTGALSSQNKSRWLLKSLTLAKTKTKILLQNKAQPLKFSNAGQIETKILALRSLLMFKTDMRWVGTDTC